MNTMEKKYNTKISFTLLLINLFQRTDYSLLLITWIGLTETLPVPTKQIKHSAVLV